MIANFFTSGAFWFVEGILVCLVVIGLKIWMEDRGVPMPAWKWILTCGWLVVLGVTIAFVGTCLGEREYHAARQGGLIFGTIVVVTGVILWRLLRIGSKSNNA